MYILLNSDYWWIYPPCILYLYPTIFRLLMYIPSVYYVFIFNYIQTTDGYTLRVFCIYIQLNSDYWWIYPLCILYLYPTIFRPLMDIPSVYSEFISNYIQTTDGYTLRVLYSYIKLYSDYWWIYPPCILYWIHQEAGTLPEEDLLCSVSAGEIVRACTYSNVSIIYYLSYFYFDIKSFAWILWGKF